MVTRGANVLGKPNWKRGVGEGTKINQKYAITLERLSKTAKRKKDPFQYVSNLLQTSIKKFNEDKVENLYYHKKYYMT